MMRSSLFLSFFGALSFLCSCTADKPIEKITERYPSGDKKATLTIYADGTIKKSNTWFVNGIKETEVLYRNGVPHGNFRQWTHLGSVILEGKYVNGKREGTWISSYPNKKKIGERYYKDGHPVGDWTGVYPDGTKAFEEHFNDQGDSINTWIKWHKNGNVAEENSCFGTIKRGVLKIYRNDGTLELEKECINGTFEGKQLHYFSDGKKIQLKENYSQRHLDGPRIFFYASGNIQKKEFWENSNRKKNWLWYDQDGNLLKESTVDSDRRTDYGICGIQKDSTIQYIVCAETTFIHYGNAIDGKLWYYKQGHKIRYEEYWNKGILEGNRNYYIDSLDGNPKGGILASEGYTLKGKRNGIWRNWYKDGSLKDSLSYVNGEQVGEQYSYDSTGRMTIHKTANGKNKPVIVHLPD